MFAHRSDPARQRGLSYTEILIATVLIAIALMPALEALQAGVRPDGSAMARMLDIHEAGGVDMVTMLVNADASANARVELYAESDGNIDFTLVGYWSTPPGVFTEIAGVNSQPSVAGSWHDGDLSSHGIPAGAVAHIAMANLANGSETQMGLREKGSTLQRRLVLQEAENGGADLAGLHVNTDAASAIQWYAETASSDQRLCPLGW